MGQGAGHRVVARLGRGGILALAVAVFAAGIAAAVIVDRATADDEDARTLTSTPPASDELAVGSTTTVVKPKGHITTPLTAEAAPPPTTIPPTTVPETTVPETTATTGAAAAITPRFTLEPYGGLGTWLDVYDWSMTFARGIPPLGPETIDRMASVGVRTLYVQAAKWDGPVDVLEPERLQPIIDRAHANGMDVVAWYLPTLVDPAADLTRLLAIAALDVEGIGVDIESREVADVAERNRRLIQLSADLRAQLPGEVLSAIVLPPVVMEDVNPNYWPGFPWVELAPYYDVWQPMAYWSFRRPESGWRDGYAYTAANIDRVRERINRLDAPVHPIGGIADAFGPDQVGGMAQAAAERGALGGSLYDFRTIEANEQREALWAAQAAFNG